MQQEAYAEDREPGREDVPLVLPHLCDTFGHSASERYSSALAFPGVKWQLWRKTQGVECFYPQKPHNIVAS